MKLGLYHHLLNWNYSLDLDVEAVRGVVFISCNAENAADERFPERSAQQKCGGYFSVGLSLLQNRMQKNTKTVSNP